MNRPSWSDTFWGSLKSAFSAGKSEHATIVARMKKDKKRLKYNVHDVKNVRQYAIRWQVIHIWFKYRFFVPALSFMDQFFGKAKVKKVNNSPHNYLLKTFDTAFEKALRLWFKHCITTGQLNGKASAVITGKMNKNPVILRMRSIKEWYITAIAAGATFSPEQLKSIKDWYVTGMSMDQTYKEFHNIFMLCLYQELGKQFAKYFPDRIGKHLLYHHRTIDQVEYFSLFEFVRKGVNVGMHHQEENKKAPVVQTPQ